MAEQESGTKATPTSEKDNLLQKIAAVDKEHDKITAKLVTLKDAGTTTDAAAWAEFGKEVDMASVNLKKAMELLFAYKGPTVTPGADDDVFGKYEQLYKAITGALVGEDGMIKQEVKTDNFEILIFTEQFLGSYPGSNDESSPINLFIMAIKAYSYNSNANNINTKLNIAKELDSNLNHELLKAVLDALAPAIIKDYLIRQPPKSLDDLLKTLTSDLSTTDETNSLTSKIKALFTATKSQGGGGSSSSYSKKNRKSHKSYHPCIGKTRKHHSHSEPKRVSFVHQA